LLRTRDTGRPNATPPEFAAYRDELVHKWTLTVTAIGVTLIPAFLILDHFTMPRTLQVRFAEYRGLVTAALLVLHMIVRWTRPGRFSFVAAYFATLLVTSMISWMTKDLGGFDSAYYAGLTLVVVSANLLLPWRALHSALNGAMVVVVYLAINARWGGPFHPETLINNLFFLGSTVAVGVAISFVKHRLIEQEFRSRAGLVEANRNLDRSRQELKAARDALWGEMEVAKRIQTALLPTNRSVGPYEVAARMQPAEEVGGDYYDIIETDAGHRWVAIGDVSGHGVESGLVMMMTQTSILALVERNPDLGPAGVFRAVNTVLVQNISRLRTGRYMTLNVVRLDADRLTIAGKHQDILVWRAAQRQVEVVSNEGCWIGVARDVNGEVTDIEVPMQPGDVALFYTDGATEAMSPGGEMFGEARLLAAFEELAAAEIPLPAAIDALFARVGAFRARQDDDVTMMLVRRTIGIAAERGAGARARFNAPLLA
jgi:sigma-B regulation protein RsbU (phosphoserine phosphatase)